jgi:hypothetical protein
MAIFSTLVAVMCLVAGINTVTFGGEENLFIDENSPVNHEFSCELSGQISTVYEIKSLIE